MRAIYVSLLALIFSGCASKSPYGNFLDEDVKMDQQQLAEVAVSRLETLYPPAKVRFELQQTASDIFGMELIKGLRNKGYAVREHDPNALSHESVTTATQILPLRYVVDQAGNSNLFRLTLCVGEESITRPYVYHDGVLAAAGYWARKE